jgi:uncharacterized membrane protein
MARLFSFRPALTLKGRRFHGVRAWAGKPTHPPLTGFPIACYALTAIFDVISLAGHGVRSRSASVRVDREDSGTMWRTTR